MSAAEAWPTEDLATKAVDKAAQRAHELSREAIEATLPPGHKGRLPQWADEPPLVRLEWRSQVLPIVWAALTDLPDPRYAAFEEGRAAGSSDTAFESEGYGTPPSSYPHENPYPSGL